jgi:hypothetical protein
VVLAFGLHLIKLLEEINATLPFKAGFGQESGQS